MEEYIGKFFDKVSDPRSSRNQRYKFTTLIGTSLLSMLSGIDSFSGMHDYVECHFSDLEQYFDLSHGCPSHDTYQRFWNALDPTKFLDAFHLFTSTLSNLSSEIINVDGKTIRNSGNTHPLHIVSAWCKNNQLVLAQEKVDSKSNEITAIPKLLDLLDLEGKIITIDAIGAQREICQKIVDQGGDYVICLKGNQGTLHKDVKALFEDESSHQYINEDNDKAHGRIEQRIAISTDQIDQMQDIHKWPGLKSVGMVKSHTIKIKTNKERNETRYYIASLKANAGRLNEIARGHWSIENQLHWKLDVVLNEDKACIQNDNASENIGILRKWALNIMAKAKEKDSQSIKSVMRKNSMSFKYLINNVKKFFHA